MNNHNRWSVLSVFLAPCMLLAGLMVTACNSGDDFRGREDSRPLSSLKESAGSVCPAGTNIIIGTKADDWIEGTDVADCIVGLEGNDTLAGLNGDDWLFGGPGDDVLIGGNGIDHLDGGEGNDQLIGGNGDDNILGGPQNDVISGENGDDTIAGGDGHDYIMGGLGDDAMDGGDGNDVLVGGAGANTVLGGSGQDICDGLGCELPEINVPGICRSDADCGAGRTCLLPAGICVSCRADTQCSNFNPCLIDNCQPYLGCQVEYAPKGTACGDPTDNECTAPDDCDGLGNCLPHHAPADAPCGDQGVLCHFDDACDGDGNCLDNGVAAQGTACGEGASECSGQDTCDAAGACQPNHFGSNVPCGPAPGECVNQDYCDGQGACADTGFLPAGEPCGDPTAGACNDPDTCDGYGACLANLAAVGTLCGDLITSECTLPDSCDSEGLCRVNHMPDDTVCDDGNACTLGDSCHGGACTAGWPLYCYDADPCTDDTCDPDSGCQFVPNDSPDTDQDGICDHNDPDDDNDLVPDGDDSAPLDRFQCRDLDQDTCDDCTSGVDDPGEDGPDADGDGICDAGDTGPEAVDDHHAALSQLITQPDTPLPIPAMLLLANDSDPNGSQLRLIDFTQPGHGTLASEGTLPLGDAFQIHSHEVSPPQQASIAVAANGDFVLAWHSGPWSTAAGSSPDESGYGITARLFHSDGTPKGTEFAVNTFTEGNQSNAVAAMNAVGDFVVVWTSPEQDGAEGGIFGQRYDSAGVAQGGEFQVNVNTARNQSAPAVAMDAAGNFVVAWQTEELGGSFVAKYNIAARRFAADGSPQGNEFRVNSYVLDSQYKPVVAANAGGDFVVAWQSNEQDGDSTGVFARRFAADGTPLGGDIPVASLTSGQQHQPGVGIDGGGGFVVAWQHGSTSADSFADLFVRRFDATGAPLAEQSLVDTSKGNLEPHVAMAGDGRFVVTYSDWWGFGYYVKQRMCRFAADGTQLGCAQVTDRVDGYASEQRAGMAGDGSFVQAWLQEDVLVQRYDSAGGTVGSTILGNSYRASRHDSPRAARDAAGNMVVVYTSAEQDGDDLGIYGQRFDNLGARLGQEFRVNTQTAGRQLSPAVAMNASGAFVAAWASSGESSSENVTDIHARRYAADGTSLGASFLVNQTQSDTQTTPRVGMADSGAFVIVWASRGQDGDNYGIFGQRFSSGGSPLGPEFQINQTSAGSQSRPDIAMDAGGAFVVAWESQGQDGSESAIVMRPYAADGTPLAAEGLVNEYALLDQQSPAVAMNRSGGEFVVAWESELQDGSSFGVVGRQYSSLGSPLGPEFIVNTHTSGYQGRAAAAMSTLGDFVVAWRVSDNATSIHAVFAQRFNGDGSRRGEELEANPAFSNSPEYPDVAMDGDGDLLIVWRQGPWDFAGIFGRLYEGFQDGLLYTPASGHTGEDTFSYTIANDLGQTDDALVTVRVNNPPTISGTPPGTIDENTPFDFTPDAADADAGDTLTFSIYNKPGWANFDTGTGNLWGTPGDGDVGTYSVIRITVHDSTGASASTPYFSITVVDVSNQPPTIGGTPPASVMVGDSYSFVPSASDPDPGDVLTFSISNKPEWADFDTLTGALSGTPDFEHIGIYDGIVITVSDLASASASLPAFAIEVVGQPNQPPEAVDDWYTEIGEELVIVAGQPTWIDASTLLANDSDPDGDPLRVIEVGKPEHGGLTYSPGYPIGEAFQVHSHEVSPPNRASIARAGNGDFLITWDSGPWHTTAGDSPDESGTGILLRLFNADATPKGTEFAVNTFMQGNQSGPVAAMDADGDLVIVWTSYEQDGDGYGIYAQRFTSAGSPAGLEFRVNNTTAGHQSAPAVAMAGDGDFIVVWQSAEAGSFYYDVFARRFNASGAPLGDEFRVNSHTESSQFYPSVAMNAAGQYVITWQSNDQDGDGAGVFARCFSSSGTPVGGEITVPMLTMGSQSDPAVGIDALGNFAVAWQHGTSDNPWKQLFVRPFGSTGMPLADQALVGSSQGSLQAHVSMASGGEFVVTYSDWPGIGYYTEQRQCHYDASATELGCSLVTDRLDGAIGDQRAAMADDGSFIQIWIDEDIFIQRYNGAGGTVGSAQKANSFRVSSHTSPQAAADLLGNAVIVWQSADQDGGGYGVYGQRFDADNQPLGAEFRVNSETLEDQTLPAVAMHPGGSFVVVWASEGQDGDPNYRRNVYGQRYDSAGAPLGSEFLVNSTTNDNQYYAAVAMAASGDFVVCWASHAQDGDDYGIYAQRFSNAGVPQGGEIQVNQTTTGYQTAPSVATDAFGAFAVAWESEDQDGFGKAVIMRRFAANGVALGPESQVNQFTLYDQSTPGIAMDAAGNLVVVWESDEQDGDSYAIVARQYDASGAALGPEFLVNTYTGGYQGRPSVSMAAAGDFVVSWSLRDNDGSVYGIYAQRFTADGAPHAGEFKVNPDTSNTPDYSAVALNPEGEVIITWRTGPYDHAGIAARRYQATGDYYLFTPTDSYYGEDRFKYTVSDGRGGTDIALVTVLIVP